MAVAVPMTPAATSLLGRLIARCRTFFTPCTSARPLSCFCLSPFLSLVSTTTSFAFGSWWTTLTPSLRIFGSPGLMSAAAKNSTV
jgi:hypothetical protein